MYPVILYLYCLGKLIKKKEPKKALGIKNSWKYEKDLQIH